jgi:hypothetical protein
MLDQVQIIKENEQAKFAVTPFDEYLQVKELLSDEEKLADYLDYLHMQIVKKKDTNRLNLADVEAELGV